MAKIELTEELIPTLGPGSYRDRHGLLLRVRGSGSRAWVVRKTLHGKTTDHGLGGWPDVSLEEAQFKTIELRRAIKTGTYTKKEPAKKTGTPKAVTFADFVETCISANQAGWKSEKSAPQFRNSLANYALPVFGKKLPKDVTCDDIAEAIKPIWTTKRETSDRVLRRIASVLDFAAAVEDDMARPNPARLPRTKILLGLRPKIAEKPHYPSMPYKDIPEFWGELFTMGGSGVAALRFAILTAARSGEVRGAHIGELDGDWWRIPASRMKAGKPHDVYLTPAAQACIPFEAEGLLFPGSRNKVMSDMTISAVLRRLGFGHYTVHGFRASFRMWAANETDFPREVAEFCLAHSLKDDVEAAYQRSNLPEKRAALLTAWADFVTGARP